MCLQCYRIAVKVSVSVLIRCYRGGGGGGGGGGCKNG